MDPERRNALKNLLELTRRLTADRALEVALRDVTETTLEVVAGSAHASVRLFDGPRQELLMGARSGEGVGSRPVTFFRREGLLFWCVQNGKPAMVNDVASDPRFVVKPGQGFSIGSVIAVPMWSADDVVGVLSTSSATSNAFTDDDLLMVQLLANCAAPSIGRARLKRLAITDAHTKAFNQGYLFVRLREELARAKVDRTPVAVLSFDLDHFKSVNDTWGHPVGDEVLRGVAERVRESVRRCDVFVRRGGEEFVLILPGATIEAAGRTAERIRSAVAERPFLVGDDLRVNQTLSIGVALWNGEETGETLEGRSDAALYRAKDQGRNCVVTDAT